MYTPSEGFQLGLSAVFFPPSVATVTGKVQTGAGKAEGGVGKSTKGGGRGGEEVPWRGVFAHQCTCKTYAEKCSSVLKKLSLSSQQERRILEETLMPLTPSSSGVTTSSRGEASSSSEPRDTIVRSLADWERKQELLERQSVNGWLLALMWMCSSSLNRVHFRAPWGSWCFDLADYFLVFHWTTQRGSTGNAEHKQRANDKSSDISTADDSMKTGRRFVENKQLTFYHHRMSNKHWTHFWPLVHWVRAPACPTHCRMVKKLLRYHPNPQLMWRNNSPWWTTASKYGPQGPGGVWMCERDGPCSTKVDTLLNVPISIIYLNLAVLKKGIKNIVLYEGVSFTLSSTVWPAGGSLHPYHSSAIITRRENQTREKMWKLSALHISG